MTKTYFAEYTDYINDLQNRLMKIQLKFNELLNNVRRDMDCGIISNEEGNKYLGVRMDQYIVDGNPNYSLPKEDTEFVREFGDLDINGQLLSTMLKRGYLDKSQKLGEIFEAVRVYGYLDSLSDKDARLTVKIALNEYYSKELKKVEDKINYYVGIYGEKEKHTVRYQTLNNDRIKLKKALDAFSHLEDAPDDVFYRIVSQFYKVKRTYYEWFLKMQIKQEYEDGNVYTEHCELMEDIQETGNTILTASDQLVKMNRVLEAANNELFNTLTSLSTFDIASVIGEETKPKKKLFKKEEPNNKEALFNLFVSLVTIVGVKRYVEEMFGNGDSSVNLNEVFEKYFKNKYGEERLFVEPNVFVNGLKDEIIAFYKEDIFEIMGKINTLNVKINSNTTMMCGNIRLSVDQARLQRDIREEYPARKDQLLISGFSMEELNRIYADLKEFIRDGFSFGTDDEEIFLRKV